MANPLDFALCNATDGSVADAPASPVDPFLGLRTHFGMLLGVEDFETEHAYHLGKMRLHNAWLHREGVIQGLRVSFDAAHGQLRVEPGLALDRAGHELYLGVAACLDVRAWYALHKDDADLKAAIAQWPIDHGAVEDATLRFDAQVAVRFRACLVRPVPALLEPCNGATSDTAWSRIAETVELQLLPGRRLGNPTYFHAARLLLGLDAPRTQADGTVTPEDQAILDRRALIVAADPATQPALLRAAVQELVVAGEESEASPFGPFVAAGGEQSLFPGPEDAWLLLANVDGLGVDVAADGTVTLHAPTAVTVDDTVRRVLLPTPLLEPIFDDHRVLDAGGPRIAAVDDGGDWQHFTLGLDAGAATGLDAATVNAGAVSLTWRDATGWVFPAATVTTRADNKAILVAIPAAVPVGATVRIVVRGTGPAPVVDTNGVPLAGGAGGAPGSASDGHDFVFMRKRSS